jgi:hypothetical protein
MAAKISVGSDVKTGPSGTWFPALRSDRDYAALARSVSEARVIHHGISPPTHSDDPAGKTRASLTLRASVRFVIASDLGVRQDAGLAEASG